MTVNDIKAAEKICPPYDADITDALTDGENEITVRVVNTLLRDANTKPGIFGPDQAVMKPSGMFGTVCLVKEVHGVKRAEAAALQLKQTVIT